MKLAFGGHGRGGKGWVFPHDEEEQEGRWMDERWMKEGEGKEEGGEREKKRAENNIPRTDNS